ncbi:MAG: 16S rRNA (guanine(527)-N(7))-methyltransferase RsmG [Anaerolineales bacterium]
MHPVFEEADIKLTPKQVQQLEQYSRLLVKWNQRINLTAIRSPSEIRVKHLLNSLTCLRVMRGTPMKCVVDVGTGAGFPGLVLKIAHSEIELTLVESITKKTNFCRRVVETLGLENVEVITARAEEVGRMVDHREMYDWGVARAVASMSVLAEYLLPLVRVGGWMLAQKGKDGHEEAQHAENAIRILGGRLDRVVPVTLPGVGEPRTLVVIEKVSPTPERYPRRIGIPAKRPLS